MFGVVFAVVIVVAAVVGAAVALGGADASSSGGEVSAAKLTVGHCVDGLKESDDVAGLPVLPCEQPHEGEVFAIVELPAGPYPGDEALGKQAQQECLKQFENYAPSSVADDKVELFYLHPSELSWTAGDRGRHLRGHGPDHQTHRLPQRVSATAAAPEPIRATAQTRSRLTQALRSTSSPSTR